MRNAWIRYRIMAYLVGCLLVVLVCVGLPLKYFFSSALTTASGEDASARSIRAKLQKMVQEEKPAKPLTDQQIVHLFQEQGIQIARRTVAKYRDQLGILPARMRKRV